MKWVRSNSLSIVFLLLFLFSIVGQVITGLKEYNEEMQDEGGQQVTINQYFSSGHFIEATFENWESEFLQMALYVVLTMFLYQKGSSESKDPEKAEEEVDRKPDPKKKDAPLPIKRGGFILKLYNHSLCISLFLLFIVSFWAHLFGSLKDYNHHQLLKGKPTETALQFIGDTKFWFESFQNWQSEFLSVFAIVILSIFLRQKGSPQSKPVDAPHSETGG